MPAGAQAKTHALGHDVGSDPCLRGGQAATGVRHAAIVIGVVH